MSIIKELFGKSPFGAIVEHTKKVNECVKVVKPLLQATADEDYEEVHRLQDSASKLEYEADKIKNKIREQIPRRYFLAVDHEELDNFLRCQDKIADAVEDFAVILLIRNTKIHPKLKKDFFAFADQVLNVSNMLMTAAEELQNLAETSFGGAEARSVLQKIGGLGEEEWRADRMQRKLSRKIFDLESELDPVTISFYEKMLIALGTIANEAENTGDLLRQMIVKG